MANTNQPIGNREFSDITVFSFHPVKIITTAEGGLATTNDPALAQKMQLLRSHGITRDANLMTHEPDGSWYYQQIDLGFNYRMTELQGALGVSQMNYLDDFVTRRHQLGKRYDELLTDLPIMLPYRNPANYSGFHLYPIQLTADSGKTRKQVFDSLRMWKYRGECALYSSAYPTRIMPSWALDKAIFRMPSATMPKRLVCHCIMT